MVASFTAMTNRLFLRRATLFLLASTTVAVAATPAAELELYPNFNALSVYVHGVEAERATVEYRRAGSSEWLPAHDLARITNETSLELGAAPLSGSLFYLQPATPYELRVTPEGGTPMLGAVTTRDDTFPTGDHVVSVRTETELRRAVSDARPGDVIELEPGTYHLGLDITGKRGTADGYILIRSRVPGSAVLDGSDATFAAGSGRWTHRGDGVYHTTLDTPRDVRCVWWDGRRLYQYFSQDDFDGGKLLGEHAMDADSVFYEGACYYDKEAARLSVRLPGRADPDELGVQVPEFNHGVVLADSQYIILDGLTIRHYGVGHDERDSYGIKVRRSSNCVVRNCVIYGVNYGIRYHDWPQPRNVDGYDNNTFERNDIYDVGPAGVSWQFYKATPPDFECATIQCQLGRGTVIRHNKLHGSFGGVKNGSLGDGNVHHPRLSGADMDVYGNEFYDLRDDGVEPDGSCNNVRIWHNAFYGVNQAISNCPNTMGPAYVVRNVFLGRPDMLVRPYSFLKFSAAEDSQGTTFVYHNTFFNARRSGEFTAALARSTDGRYFRLRNNVLVVRGVPDHTEIAQLLQREHHDFDYDLLYKDRVGEKENFDPFLQIAGANGKNMYLYDLQGMRSELGWEMHGVEADPQFVGGANPMSAADLHLTEGSPAVDAGLWIPNISDGWGGVRGAGPDMGAFEWPDE